MTEPEMELYPPPRSKARVLNLDVGVPADCCVHTGAEKREVCASKDSKSSSKEPLQFPT